LAASTCFTTQVDRNIWGLRMHVGSALRPRSEARSVPPLPQGIHKKNLLA
jgi:hypothetical protein